MKAESARKIRWAGLILFALYLTALVYVLFFAEMYGRRPGEAARINLVPFREIRRFLTNVEVLGKKAVLVNIGGNILAFCPFGAILPVLQRKLRSWWKIVLITAAFSSAIEIIQLLTRVGACDVDDVILNTLGGFAGYLIFAVCDSVRKKWFGVVRDKNV